MAGSSPAKGTFGCVWIVVADNRFSSTGQPWVAGEDALVPVPWFYVASAVLSREQNRGNLAAPKAEDFIAELQALPISAEAESAARVFGDVHGLALAYRLTFYHAAYLELPLRHSLPLATLDDDLIRASKAAGSTVL